MVMNRLAHPKHMTVRMPNVHLATALSVAAQTNVEGVAADRAECRFAAIRPTNKASQGGRLSDP